MARANQLFAAALLSFMAGVITRLFKPPCVAAVAAAAGGGGAAAARSAASAQTLAEHYDLHPLAIEDVINFQRIKCIRCGAELAALSETWRNST
jgi:hypothetical protein